MGSVFGSFRADLSSLKLHKVIHSIFFFPRLINTSLISLHDEKAEKPKWQDGNPPGLWLWRTTDHCVYSRNSNENTYIYIFKIQWHGKNSLLIKCLAFSLMNRSVLLDLASFLRIRRLGMICCIASLLSLHVISLSIIVIFLHSKCPCVLEHVHWLVHGGTCEHLCASVHGGQKSVQVSFLGKHPSVFKRVSLIWSLPSRPG